MTAPTAGTTVGSEWTYASPPASSSWPARRRSSQTVSASTASGSAFSFRWIIDPKISWCRGR